MSTKTERGSGADPLKDKLSKGEVSRMPESDLLDLQTELGKVLGRMQSEGQRIRGNLVRVKNELRLRREGGKANGEPIVSDHAVVRYLERHRGVNVQSIRDEIREIAKRSKYERDEKRRGERLTDAESGVTMVYSTDRNSIATILSGDAKELLDGAAHTGETP